MMEYLLSILDNLAAIACGLFIVSACAFAASIIYYFGARADVGYSNGSTASTENFESAKFSCRISIPLLIFSIIMFALIPARNDLIKARLMIVGSEYITKGQVDLFIKAVDNKVDKAIDAMKDKPVETIEEKQ